MAESMIDSSNVTISVRFTSRLKHYGTKLTFAKVAELTKSAKYAKTHLNALGFDTSVFNNPKETPKEEDNQESEKTPADEGKKPIPAPKLKKTTVTVKASIGAKTAVALLNQVDQKLETPDYREKSRRYSEKKDEINKKLGDPSRLVGDAKKEYVKAMKPYAFDYYETKVTIYVRDKSTGAIIETYISRYHRRLQYMTEEDILTLINKVANRPDISEMELVKVISKDDTAENQSDQSNPDSGSDQDNS